MMKSFIIATLFAICATPAFAESNICDVPKVKVAMAEQITKIVQSHVPGFEVVDITDATTIATGKNNFSCHVTIEDNDGDHTSGTYREYASKMDPDQTIVEFKPD